MTLVLDSKEAAWNLPVVHVALLLPTETKTNILIVYMSNLDINYNMLTKYSIGMYFKSMYSLTQFIPAAQDI